MKTPLVKMQNDKHEFLTQTARGLEGHLVAAKYLIEEQQFDLETSQTSLHHSCVRDNLKIEVSYC